MAKEIVKYAHRVVIDVWERWGPYGSEEGIAKRIITEIERHIDNVGPRKDMRACHEYSVYTICSFCRNDWEVDETDGCPICCNEAVDEWEKRSKHA